MSHSSSAKCVEVIRQCLLERTASHHSAQKGGPQNQILDDWIADFFDRQPAINRLISDKCLLQLKEARQSAAAGGIEDACRFIAQARISSTSDRLKPEIQILLTAQRAASEAYLEYCCGDYEQAEVFLREAISCDSILEDNYGFRLFFANRLHHMNNLVRTRGLSGNLKESMILARDVALYSGRVVNRVPGFWEGGLLDAMPTGMVEASTGELLSQIALLLSSASHAQCCEAATMFFEDWNLIGLAEKWPEQLRQWFYVKHEYLCNDPHRFLETCCTFVARGQGDWPLLWIMVIVDAAVIATSLILPAAEMLRREVLQTVASSKYIPHIFKGNRLQLRGASGQHDFASQVYVNSHSHGIPKIMA